jgi:two-component system, NtrC family, nitrogen regulation sensor histidine kinase NtrY
MSDFKKIRNIGLVALALALASLSTDRLYFSNLEWKYRTMKVSHELDLRKYRAGNLIKETEGYLMAGGSPSSLAQDGLNRIFSKDEILLLVYSKGKIAFWSNNNVSFPPVYSDSISTKKEVFISNEWFIPICHKVLNYDIVALVGLGKSYSISNGMLRSGFLETYSLPESTGLSFSSSDSRFHVIDKDGTFNFSILYPNPKPNTLFLIFPLFFWLSFFVTVLLLINAISAWLSKTGRVHFSLLIAFLALALLYSAILITGKPDSIHSTKLFSRFIFSSGLLIPSVGHLFIMSILLLDMVYVFFKTYPENSPSDQMGNRYLALTVAIILFALISFLLINNVFIKLVAESTANLEAYKILDINIISVIGILSILFLLFIPPVLILKAFRMQRSLPSGTVMLITLLSAAIVFTVAALADVDVSIAGIIFIVASSAIILLWERTSLTLFTLLALFSVVSGFYTTAVIIKYSEHRGDEAMKVMAVSIANEHDLVAESMLLDMWPSLESDTTLRRMMRKEYFPGKDLAAVDKYLSDHYFTGYWENYDLRDIVCFDDSPLQLPLQAGNASNCFFYFDNEIKERGSPITGTDFWFIENEMGRADYLTRLFYYVSPFLTTGLFIELTNHIEAYQAGYPELLIDEARQRFPKLKGISYAKYKGNNLLMQSGDYQYENKLFTVDFKDSEYQFVNRDKYRHLLYNRGDMTVVISKLNITAFDKTISFAYLFIITLILTLLVIMVFVGQSLGFLRFDTFRRKLQLAFASMLAVVFVIVIIAALLVSIKRFTENHTHNLREKIKSVALELELDMVPDNIQTGVSKTLNNNDLTLLNSLLVKLSNVFLSDINMYDLSGELIATSRPEIFLKQLEGTRMNADAWNELTVNNRMEYIREERIGNLKYLSAYMPLFSTDNHLIAYINLPYFKMQDLLAGEISSLVVTVINFTFLLMMLILWLAVFISDRLTNPLQLLQRALASVELGKKSEHLKYSSKDEVGDMVKQYNRMIDELDDSAKKLARSERELAWREMARQIAHEIKNPLTPMKLNVQQLLRWWKDGAPDFNKRLETFTGNQIEYIDNLSSIATAFSNFARLPSADPVEMDLITQLKIAVELFDQTEGINISLDCGTLAKVIMMADKEHMNGIFSNLIKNAIQAIPAGRVGKIEISVSAKANNALLIFKDNGQGIPEELKSKMFTPNFTTKSSGMGLGLSIVKRYVETAGGTVWYESTSGTGTSFFIDLPVLYYVEKFHDS